MTGADTGARLGFGSGEAAGATGVRNLALFRFDDTAHVGEAGDPRGIEIFVGSAVTGRPAAFQRSKPPSST
jgi:hypothetical protein